MTTHLYYQWKEVRKDENDNEFPFDFMYDTPRQACEGLLDMGVEPEESDEWLLVKVTEEPVERPS